jgi:TM2 domain-containing membrane protein YozV
MSDPIRYYVMIGKEKNGPYTLGQLQAMWRAGSITVDTQYWFDGQSEWMPLSTILELIEPQERSRMPQSYFAPPVQVVRATKSRGIYIILGLFLGFLGIHNFYAGYYGRGAAQLIITVILGWFLIGLVITGLWVLVEIFTVKIDGNGGKMT